MRRVDAPRDTAQVVAFLPERDGPAETLVDDAMSFSHATCDPDIAIAPGISGTNPLPAARDVVWANL